MGSWAAAKAESAFADLSSFPLLAESLSAAVWALTHKQTERKATTMDALFDIRLLKFSDTIASVYLLAKSAMSPFT